MPKQPARPRKSAASRSPKEDFAAKKRRTAKIVAKLRTAYPDAECALVHRSPFELLVATILSAQCTDARVNMVTPALFKKYPAPAAFAAAPGPAIEKAIQSTGFFRNKAKAIKGAATAIVDQHGGNVPQEIDELVALPGVGRKTANVVLGVAFDKATGVVVDTHVGRVSRRLALTDHSDPLKVEADLMALLPQNQWIDYSHQVIHHGRQICIARRPKCDSCTLSALCPKIGVTPDKQPAAPPKRTRKTSP